MAEGLTGGAVGREQVANMAQDLFGAAAGKGRARVFDFAALFRWLPTKVAPPQDELMLTLSVLRPLPQHGQTRRCEPRGPMAWRGLQTQSAEDGGWLGAPWDLAGELMPAGFGGHHDAPNEGLQEE